MGRVSPPSRVKGPFAAREGRSHRLPALRTRRHGAEVPAPGVGALARRPCHLCMAVAFDQSLNHRTGRLASLYPARESENVGIAIVGAAVPGPFACVAADALTDVNLLTAATHYYARWRYEDAPVVPTLLDAVPSGRVSNLNPEAVTRFRTAIGTDLTDDDVFYYVYGILHAPDFRSTFESNLKKEKPSVPLVESRVVFDAFVAAGRELCELHVGYETVEPCPLTEEWAAGADPETNPTCCS